jgi:hypothetical protein
MFNIDNASNDVGTLAASITGSLSYSDANALTIGSITSFDGTATSNTSGVMASAVVNLGGTGALTLNGVSSWSGNTNFGARPVTVNGALNLSGALTVGTGASLLTNGGAISATSINVGAGGLFGGSGSITGNIVNGGTVAPGNSPGALTIAGDYTQGPNATLAVELGGTAAGTYDTLDVTGMALLDGTLTVSMFGGFIGSVGDVFPVISASMISGNFATVSVPAGYGFNTNYLPTIYPSSLELELTEAPAALAPQPVLDFIVTASLPLDILPPPEEEKKPDTQAAADVTPQPDSAPAAAPLPVCQ